MPGRVFNRIAEIAADQHGLVTTKDVREAGIDPRRLTDLARRGTADHIGYGIYRLPLVGGTPALEQLIGATKWPQEKGVLSHDTALDVHELCDINPARIHITIPTDLRLWKETPPVYELHRRDLGARDVTYHEGIPIVTARRAILDGIETGVRTDLLRQAIDNASKRGMLRPDAEHEVREALRERGRGGG